MSRVPANILRTTCNTQNSPFIGVSAYYFYDQLKINYGVQKAVQMLGKQLAFPTISIKNKKSAVPILQTALLPLSTLLRAKNFFCVQLLHSKHHFKNKIITGAKQLQPYTFFSNKTFQSANWAKNTSNTVELIKQLCFRPLIGRDLFRTSRRLLLSCITLFRNKQRRPRAFSAAVATQGGQPCIEKQGIQQPSKCFKHRSALFYENKKQKSEKKAVSYLSLKNLFVLACVKNLVTKKLIRPKIDLISKPFVKSLAKEAYARLKTVYAKTINNSLDLKTIACSSNVAHTLKNQLHMQSYVAYGKMALKQQQQTLKKFAKAKAKQIVKVDQTNQKRFKSKTKQFGTIPSIHRQTAGGLGPTVSLDAVPFTTALWAYPKLLICRTFNATVSHHVFCLLQGRLNKSQWHQKRPNKALFAPTTENYNKSNFWHNNVALAKSKNAVVFEMYYTGPTNLHQFHGDLGVGVDVSQQAGTLKQTKTTKQMFNSPSTAAGLILRKTVTIRL